MNILATLFDSPLIHSLGWTLVHFIWQGAVVGAVYVSALQFLKRKSPASRYHLAMGTLAVMAILPIITFIHLAHTATDIAADRAAETLANAAAFDANQSIVAPYSMIDHLKLGLQSLVPWAVPAWLLGVLAMTLRVWRGWRHADRLRQSAQFMPLTEWYAVVETLRTLLGINKLVRLAVSSSVVVPSVIGWLKPIILIPPSVIAGLTTQQMELVLAHELAHIRRQDYLWNLLQITVETLLFYHPVVRWVSHQARLEREQCCDDLVVGLHGNTLEYARALTELESLRHPRNALLLGASGGQVLDRVHRLLGQPAPSAPTLWLPLLLAVGLLFASGIMRFASDTTVVHSILTEKYTLLGERAQIIPAPIKTSPSSMSPTRVSAGVSIQTLGSLTPVRIPDVAPVIGLSTASSLRAPVRPPITTVAHPETPSTRQAPMQSRVGGGVISRISPIYPMIALERGTEGSATLEFTLTKTGAVADIRVISVTGSRLFGTAASEAIRQWKFVPVTIAGVPVTQRMTEEFIFRLSTQGPMSGACKIPMGYHVCFPN